MTLSTSIVVLGLLALASVSQAQSFSFGPMSAYAAAGSSTHYLATGDLNGDGFPDIVSSNFNPNFDPTNLSVLLGQAAGGFAPAVTYATGSSIGNNSQEVLLADMNSDGKLDAVVANYGTKSIAVLLGTGTGTLGTAQVFPTGSSTGGAFGLRLADVNGDGKLDAVVTNITNVVSVLPGTGTGTFGAPVFYPVNAASSLRGLAVADFNHDGRPDVVVSDLIGGTLYVLLGQVSGFTTPVSYSLTSSSYFVEVADLNRDGQLDLIASSIEGGMVAVLTGTATGTFNPAVYYQATTNIGSFLSGLTVSDMNGDGFPDVAVADNTQNQVSLLPGTSTGALGAPSVLTVGAGPYDILLVDVSRDGRPDILVANSGFVNGASVVGVLLNTGLYTPLATRATLPGVTTSLWPNPVSAATTLTVAGLPASVAQVQATLLDATGRAVEQRTLAMSQGSARVELVTAGLAAGLYVVRLAVLDARGEAAGALPAQRLSVRE